MIDKKQLRSLVKETLQEIGLYSIEAENLILGTIAQESAGGKYIKQITGPALGICQMESRTHDDIWYNFLEYRKSLFNLMVLLVASGPNADEMRWNLKYAIAMCRVHYLRVPEPIPFSLNSQAAYWKKYYNTPRGAGTIEQYVGNYKKYVQ